MTSESAAHVRVTHKGEVVRIALDRPDRGNSLTQEAVRELTGAVRRANLDGARLILLEAQGPFFCVGGDLTTFAGAENLALFVDDLAEGLHRVVSELVRSEAIVVAAVQGHAAGAGVSLAAAADIIVAAESSTFSMAYTSVGLSNDGGSSLLVNTLGLHRMLRLALLNDRLTAQEAFDAGLVARVVPDSEMRAAVDDLARRMADGPRVAFARAKALLRDAAEPHPESVMRRETLAIRQAAATDGPEGVRAFLEKRAPRFLPGADTSSIGER